MKPAINLFRILLCAAIIISTASAQINSERSRVISYDIKVQTNKKSASIADLYDGGSKTIFLDGNKARVRLVSLMRIESIYLLPSKDSGIQIFRVKESTLNPLKQTYDWANWKKFHAQYDSAVFTALTDTLTIKGYLCNKGMLQLKNGKVLELWFTKQLPAIPAHVEPSFVLVPGLVLQYRYQDNNVAVTYTATSVNNAPLHQDIFNVEKAQRYKIVL